MEIELLGLVGDPSGYGHDCRQTAHAMLLAGLPLTITRVSMGQDLFSCDYGDIESVLRPYIREAKNPKIQIMHSTPDCWPAHAREDCYVIGKTVWETDRINPIWVECVKKSGVKEIWLPNQFNIDVFKKDLPDVHMVYVPHAHDTGAFVPGGPSLDMSGIGIAKEDFVFGAGFQWSNRKNPEGLISAFLAEFRSDEPVALMLKTFGLNTSDKSNEHIRSEILRVTKTTNLRGDHAKIAHHGQILPFDKQRAWFESVDCGVYPHRGEGWGLHISESMLMGTPCIVTNWSGTTEYCTEENSYLLDYQMTPVRGMEWNKWYNSKQSWAEPDLLHLRKLMRAAFDGRENGELVEKGKIARQDISERYNLASVGGIIKSRVDEICASL